MGGEEPLRWHDGFLVELCDRQFRRLSPDDLHAIAENIKANPVLVWESACYGTMTPAQTFCKYNEAMEKFLGGQRVTPHRFGADINPKKRESSFGAWSWLGAICSQIYSI